MEYYTVIENKVSEDVGIYFCLPIRWNVSQIAGGDYKSGYIVQHMRIKSSSQTIPSADYFEAWPVENGKITDPPDKEFRADDIWRSVIKGVESFVEEDTGEIIHTSDVYWFSSEDIYAHIIDSWKRNSVVEAGELKASTVAPAPEESMQTHFRCHREHIKRW